VSARRTPLRGRVGGAILFVLGGGLGAWTLYASSTRGVVVAPMLLTLGLWLVVFGEPIDEKTGELAGWGKLGLGISVGIGLAIGIVAQFLM